MIRKKAAMNTKRKQSLKTAGLYALFGALWIAASDHLLLFAINDKELLLAISSIKGFLFVAVTACLLYLLLTLQKEQNMENGDVEAVTRPRKRSLFLASAGLALVVPLLSYGIIHLHGRQMEKEARANLWAMASFKAEQIGDWLEERQANGKELACNLGFIERVEQWLYHGAAQEEERLMTRLGGHFTLHGYHRILLLDKNLRPVLTLGEGPAEITPSSNNLLRQAGSRGEVLRSELYRDQSGKPLLDWVVPLALSSANGNKRAVGFIVLQASPERFLGPLLQDGLSGRSSTQFILTRPSNSTLLFLTAPGPHPGPAFTSPALGDPPYPPGTTAMLTMEGRDSRNVAVLAAVHPVAGSDWLLLAKIDHDEVLAHFRSLVFWVSLAAMAVMAALLSALFLFWRQQLYAHRLALLSRTMEKDLLLRKFFDLPFVGMAIIAPENKRWLQFNDRLCEILGYSREELAGLSWMDMTLADDLAADNADFAEILQGGSEGCSKNKRFLRKDGEVIIARIDIKCLRHDNGTVNYFMATVDDITRRTQTEEQLRLNAAIMAVTRDAMVVTDLTPKIIAVNPAFVEMTGYSEEEVLGQSPSILKSGRHDPAFFHNLMTSLQENDFWQGEIWNRRKNGEIYPEWLTISTVRNEQEIPTHYVSVSTDLSRLKQSEEQLHHLAHFDPLTGLPNRLLLEARLQHTLERAAREQTMVAVLIIDLDQFKTINESLGYTAGDELLVAITKRMGSKLRDEDTLARMVGDQFALVMETPQGDSSDSQIMAARIRAALEASFTLPDGYEAYVQASIGISVFPQDGDTAQALLVRAEAAMHRAKECGGNQFCYYTSEINQKARTSLDLQGALRQALDNEELLLYYQPKIDLNHGRITGAEALVRWQRPGHGLVPPMQFIPVAEKCGLIEAIGSWVIENACWQIKAWREEGLPDVSVAVNVSARQFRSNTLERIIIDLLAHYEIKPRQLVLELTESILMDDPDETVNRLLRLKNIGVRLSLDDFGTGYSSLTYLSRFPIDQMKIDRSFVNNIVTDPSAATIATSIIALAHRMGLEVVAEGVENEAQLGYLRQNNCDKMQGYLFSRPVPADEFALMLRSSKTLRLPYIPWEARTLLLVDDEPNVLSSLRRVLLEEGYQILTATSATEGLEVLAMNPAQVIISDQRMPQMNGTEFFGRVKNLYPDTVRIVLSGYADLETVTRAVNEGALFKFLPKPWNDDQLRNQIREAFLYHEAVIAPRRKGLSRT